MSAHSYWRILVKTCGGSYVGIYSLDFQNAAGASLCTGGTPICSTQYATYAPARAFPGGAFNWIANNEAAGAWLGYHFAAPVTVEKVLMAGFGPCADTPTKINTAVLQSSDNGIAWSDEFETDAPGGGWVSATPVTYNAPPPAVAIPSINQAALIVVGNERASGATVSQLAIITVGREYKISNHLHGYLIPAIWGDGYYIERGQLI